MLKNPRNEARDNFFYEREALSKGYKRVAGIDEAGRGPLAGPVVAAAVVVPVPGFNKERIDDSKKLTALQRERAFLEIVQHCDVGIGLSCVEEIDSVNIFNATLKAMKTALGELKTQPDYLLIDGHMNVDAPQPRNCMIRGDSKSVSIAAASIIAKVFRDRLMLEEDKKYPEYFFRENKGYGTSRHMEAIRKFGLTPIHRRTFGPFGDLRKD